MPREAKNVNISEIQSLADFLRLAEEVQKTKEPALLRQDGVYLELRLAKPARTSRAKGRLFTKDDSLWDIVGMFKADDGPTDVSANVDEYLAEGLTPTRTNEHFQPPTPQLGIR